MTDHSNALRNLATDKPLFNPGQTEAEFSLGLLDSGFTNTFIQSANLTKLSFRYVTEEERDALELDRLIAKLGVSEALARLKRPLDHKGDACA